MDLAHLAEHRRQVLTRKGSVFTAQNARRRAEAPRELIHLRGSQLMKEKARPLLGRPIPAGAASQRPGEIDPDSCGRSV